MKYSQFCPIAKATEVLGDRWTLLIVREALMGASRFSEFQRGLGSISTAVLTERPDRQTRLRIFSDARLQGIATDHRVTRRLGHALGKG